MLGVRCWMMDVPGIHLSLTSLFLQAMAVTPIEFVLEGNSEE
jgi:hypothetical protein